MSIHQTIETALSGLVNGNIWPLSKPVTEDPQEYIIYNVENEYLDYGDDQDQGTELSFQVHWFKRGQANYLAKRADIRTALREAGFLLEPSSRIIYEKDNSSGNTGWTHVVIVCRVEAD